MNNTVTLTMQDLSAQLGLPKSTIRYWEKEFSDLIRPRRTPGGQRRYSQKHLTILKGIDEYKKLGLSLTEIKHYLSDRSMPPGNIKEEDVEALLQRIVLAVRKEIHCYLSEQRCDDPQEPIRSDDDRSHGIGDQ